MPKDWNWHIYRQGSAELVFLGGGVTFENLYFWVLVIAAVFFFLGGGGYQINAVF